MSQEGPRLAPPLYSSLRTDLAILASITMGACVPITIPDPGADGIAARSPLILRTWCPMSFPPFAGPFQSYYDEQFRTQQRLHVQ